jgi:hypothetical protein
MSAEQAGWREGGRSDRRLSSSREKEIRHRRTDGRTDGRTQNYTDRPTWLAQLKSKMVVTVDHHPVFPKLNKEQGI